MAFASLFISVVVSSGTPGTVPWVLVPDPALLNCPYTLPITTQIESTPGLVTTRTSSTGSELNQLVEAIGADYGIEVGPAVAEAGVTEIIIHRHGKTYKAQASSPYAALSTIWPADSPPLAAGLTRPSLRLLKAACNGQTLLMEKLAAAALVPLLSEAFYFDSPNAPKKSILWQWARAKSLLSDNRPEHALRVMLPILHSIKNEPIGPIWRKRPALRSDSGPSALTLSSKGLFTFENGTLALTNIVQGQGQWDRALGRMDSRPQVLPEGDPLLVIHEHGFRALAADSGELLWKTEFVEPHPEVVARPQKLILGGYYELRAVDRQTGQSIWSQSLPEASVAGPVDLNTQVAVPVGSDVRFFDSATGEPVHSISVGDEVSSPLFITPKGLVWALVGSDEVIKLNPLKRRTEVRFSHMTGTTWPPLMLDEKLVLYTQRQNRGQLRWLNRRKASQLNAVPAQAPVVLLSDGRGLAHFSRNRRALSVRNRNLRTIGRHTLPSPGLHLASYKNYSAVGLEDGLLFVHLGRGTKTHFPLEAPVSEVAMGPSGTVALLDNGVIYGWPHPEDLRRKVWLRRARQTAAHAALMAKQYGQAQRIAQEAIGDESDNLVALEQLAEAFVGQNDRRAIPSFLQLHHTTPENAPPRKRAEARLLSLGLTYVSTSSTGLASSPSKAEPSARRKGLNFKVIHTLDLKTVQLVAGANILAAIHPKTSRIKWRRRFPKEPIIGLYEVRGSVVVLTRRRLLKLTPRQGQLGKQIRFKTKVRFAVKIPDDPTVFTYDGVNLTQFNIAKLRRAWNVSLTDVSALSLSDRIPMIQFANGSTWMVATSQ